MAIARGNVVGLRRENVGIIWSISASQVLIIPVGGYNGPPPHRAEVRITEASEAMACGVSIKFPVIRCQQIYQLPRSSIEHAAVMGHASDVLMARIRRAVIREADAQVAERRLFGNDTTTPTFLVAL